MHGWIKAYERVVLGRPLLTVLVIVTGCIFFAYQAQFFKLDASSDSLLLENDADLRFYQLVRREYPSDDYLVVTYTPTKDMFGAESLAALKGLTTDLKAIAGVDSVFSILDAPLLRSPKIPMLQLASGYKTLAKDADPQLARLELTESPLFRDYLISRDGLTSGILINFAKDEDFETLASRRDDLRALKYEKGLSEAENQELIQVSNKYRIESTQRSAEWKNNVARVRTVLKSHNKDATLFLGGIPMIVADMISFVRKDLTVFGLGVLLFLMATLALIFRRPRWVILPLLTCSLSVLVMIGILGWLDWRATVISSNFTSLLLIIGMSMAIHLVVRFREIQAAHPEKSQRELTLAATRLVALPCFYCALTTIVGFGSLYFSEIRPVMEFGKMMGLGIGLAYVMCFTLLPALLLLMPKGPTPVLKQTRHSLTARFASFTEKRGRALLLVAGLLALLGFQGIARLTVENKFIDYFKKTTEIYQGMEVIDAQLGGTTPLEIILSGEGKDFWFRKENLARLRRIHDYLEGMPESGKVLSLDTMIRAVEHYNDGKPINALLLGMVRQFLPADIKSQVLDPFANDDFTQVRIVVRVQESSPDLRREVLLRNIRGFLEETMAMTPDEYRLTGMYVLYNNMLQSLFRSQISTIGAVFLATWLMFALLFRSFYLATIGLIPNAFPVIVVLGVLGWLGIPLDMMTITIAAITIGIAVDHTIHYIHRFKEEFKEERHYLACMHRCHSSIGKAMYYTSITIIAGFSILAFSNFMPTIYFGLFTGLAMVVALLAAMTLLPRLIVVIKPLGPEAVKAEKTKVG